MIVNGIRKTGRSATVAVTGDALGVVRSSASVRISQGPAGSLVRRGFLVRPGGYGCAAQRHVCTTHKPTGRRRVSTAICGGGHKSSLVREAQRRSSNEGQGR